jgi:AraC-like DNA-binding protein
MRGDVIHFRRICNNLVNGKTRTAKQIAQEMGISDLTLKKLLTAELDETFHIRASVLGLIQDFSKKYTDYERLNIEPEPEQDQNREWFEKLKGKEIKIKLDPPQPAYKETPGEKILQEELRPGVVITITIQTQIA